MEITYFNVKGVCLITPKTLGDERGFFQETYRADLFNEAAGNQISFVQENHALSRKAGIVRGLHYQSPPNAQGKLVSCTAGAVLDVIVDVRRASTTYGEKLSVELSKDSGAQLWIPPGFLHGYISLEDNSEFFYKVTSYYDKETEGAIFWNDSDLNIDWGIDARDAIVSDKDANAERFKDFVTPF